MNKFIREKDGLAILVFIPIMIGMLFMAGMVLDWGRAMVARGQLETISDAAALAGASTAKVMTEVEETEENGEKIIKENVTGLQIDTIEAYNQAYTTARLNGATNEYWESVGGSWGEIEGNVIGDDGYGVKSSTYLKLTFLKPIFNEIFGDSDLNITMPGYARAFAIKDNNVEKETEVNDE